MKILSIDECGHYAQLFHSQSINFHPACENPPSRSHEIAAQYGKIGGSPYDGTPNMATVGE